MGAYYVGLDVHSQFSAFVIQDEAGTSVARGTVPTTPEGLAGLCQAHRLPGGTTVALETGTTSFYVARLLTELQAHARCHRCPRGPAQGASPDAEE